MDQMDQDLAVLPAPAADQTLGTTKTRRIRTTDKRKMRPKKGLVQLNVKIRGPIKDQFEAAFVAARATTPGLTKGEFMELAIAAIEAMATGANLTDAVVALGKTAVPSAKDARDGRNQEVRFFATPALVKGIEVKSQTHGWTAGEAIENAFARAARLAMLEAELAQPCPSCGKGRE